MGRQFFYHYFYLGLLPVYLFVRWLRINGTDTRPRGLPWQINTWPRTQIQLTMSIRIMLLLISAENFIAKILPRGGHWLLLTKWLQVLVLMLLTLLRTKTFNILLSNVTVNFSNIYNSDTRYGNIKSQKTKNIYSETLDKLWNIDIGKAKKTETRTTQRGFQRLFHPMIGRQYPTNYWMICYKRMPDHVYAYTLKSGVMYKRRNNYGQAYWTLYVLSRCHPMAQKSKARDILSLVFKCDGVLPKMIVEKSK